MHWWMDKRGAERAADHHQLEHEALTVLRRKPFKGNDRSPRTGEYQQVSEIPAISVEVKFV